MDILELSGNLAVSGTQPGCQRVKVISTLMASVTRRVPLFNVKIQTIVVNPGNFSIDRKGDAERKFYDYHLEE